MHDKKISVYNIIGEVITDQAKADEDASLTERVVMAVGKFPPYIRAIAI